MQNSGKITNHTWACWKTWPTLTLPINTLHILSVTEVPDGWEETQGLCKSELADISKLQHVTPLLKVKAAVHPLQGFIYCHISNSRQSVSSKTWKPVLSHHATKEARFSSCTVDMCFWTTTSISRLLLKRNRLTVRNSSAAWHLFYLCNPSQTALYFHEGNKHLLCTHTNIK